MAQLPSAAALVHVDLEGPHPLILKLHVEGLVGVAMLVREHDGRLHVIAVVRPLELHVIQAQHVVEGRLPAGVPLSVPVAVSVPLGFTRGPGLVIAGRILHPRRFRVLIALAEPSFHVGPAT